jgi:hypothetical protein
MTRNSRNDPSPRSPLAPAAVDSTVHGGQHRPITDPTDAEKYRWIRANRGNFAIVEALDGCDRDADFDARIAAEMAMCAAGKASYRIRGNAP